MEFLQEPGTHFVIVQSFMITLARGAGSGGVWRELRGATAQLSAEHRAGVFTRGVPTDGVLQGEC